MRRSFLESVYRPSARTAQLLDLQRRAQRSERAPARLSPSTASEVERRVRRALPLNVTRGSRVDISVRVR